jgi:hypothetical protein
MRAAKTQRQYLAGTRERDAGGGFGHSLADRLGNAERDVLTVDLSSERGQRKRRQECGKDERKRPEKRRREREREKEREKENR